ncbi:MAG: FeoC-like transcriptional regulator [Alphaproteobacteria bacterium]|nr:FeoC-like transcriptional regulator [Alphaproteobacteria bacterium]
MVVLDLKNYLRQHKRVSLTEMSQHFSIDSEALRGMLDYLIAKGKVKKLEHISVKESGCDSNTTGCSGCIYASNMCASLSVPEVFMWVEVS